MNDDKAREAMEQDAMEEILVGYFKTITEAALTIAEMNGDKVENFVPAYSAMREARDPRAGDIPEASALYYWAGGELVTERPLTGGYPSPEEVLYYAIRAAFLMGKESKSGK